MASNPAVVAIETDRVKELITREEERFRAGRRRSDELWREAQRVEPRGVPSSFQDAAPQPVFVDRGKGSRIWDVDGNEYRPAAYLAWLYQCNRGVLMAPGAEENWTISVQHSEEDVQRYVDNFAEMARDLRA